MTSLTGRTRFNQPETGYAMLITVRNRKTFTNWLTGFVGAEGSFATTQERKSDVSSSGCGILSVEFSCQLREDDEDLLKGKEGAVYCPGCAPDFSAELCEADRMAVATSLKKRRGDLLLPTHVFGDYIRGQISDLGREFKKDRNPSLRFSR